MIYENGEEDLAWALECQQLAKRTLYPLWWPGYRFETAKKSTDHQASIDIIGRHDTWRSLYIGERFRSRDWLDKDDITFRENDIGSHGDRDELKKSGMQIGVVGWVNTLLGAPPTKILNAAAWDHLRFLSCYDAGEIKPYARKLNRDRGSALLIFRMKDFSRLDLWVKREGEKLKYKTLLYFKYNENGIKDRTRLMQDSTFVTHRPSIESTTHTNSKPSKESSTFSGQINWITDSTANPAVKK